MCHALWLRFAAQSLPLTRDSEGDFYPSKLSGAPAFASFTAANVIGRRARPARSLAGQAGGCDGFLRAGLALMVFQERGLITLSCQEERVTLCLNPIQGKVDLQASPYLLRIRNGA